MAQGNQTQGCEGAASKQLECLRLRGLVLEPGSSLDSYFQAPDKPAGSIRHSPADTRRVRDYLGSDQVVVRYFVAGDQIEAMVLANGMVHFFALHASIRATRQRVDRLTSLMRAIPRQPELLRDQSWRHEAAALYEQFLRPLESLLDDAELVTIIPADALRSLSFDMLIRRPAGELNPGAARASYAFQRYLFSTAQHIGQIVPSARPRTVATGLRVLVVGNPANTPLESAGMFRPLPSAEEEAGLVNMMFPASTFLVGKQATRARVLDRLRTHDLVHFATHGKTMEDAKASFLVLAPDDDSKGLLTAADILGVKVKSDLVVLSACETAASSAASSDDSHFSLATAFLEAGSKTVVATLWQVHSEATQLFMERFYKEYGAASTLENLHEAREALLADERYSHPYFWAPFVLHGSPR